MAHLNGSNGHSNGNGNFISHHLNSNGFLENGTANGSHEPSSNKKSSQHEFDVRLIWGMLARHKYAILTFTLVTTILFGFIAYTIDPVYESEGSILISESKAYNPPSSNGVSAMVSSMYRVGGSNEVDDEMQILQSRTLSMEMADKLIKSPKMENGQKYPVLWQDYPENSNTTSQDTVAERIRKNISFSQAEKSKLINISYKSRSPLEAAKMVNLAIDTYSDFSSDQNSTAAHSAVQFLQDEKQRIQNDLKEAEAELRTFMNKEDLVELDSQTDRMIGSIADLRSNLQSIKVKLVSVESAIDQHIQRLNDIKPQLVNNYSDAVLPKLDRFQYQLAELETEKMLMISRNPDIQKMSEPPTEFQRLNSKIATLKQDIRSMTQQIIDDNGNFAGSVGSTGQKLAENISNINEQLIELKVEKNQYEAQQEVLRQRLNEERSTFDKLPNNMIQLARMKREVEINEGLYRTVSQQLAEMKLWEKTRFGPGRSIDKGFVPDKASNTSTALYLLAGLFLGGFLGICYTCIREFTNSKINRIEQVNKYGTPVLALIPTLGFETKGIFSNRKSKENAKDTGISHKLVTLKENQSTRSESFRRLSNNLVHAKPNRELQTIMLTSYGKDEGTDIVSSNLAIALAGMGKKVLVIDCDFRRPDLHTLFGIENPPGMVEVLYDDARLDDVITQTEVPNLELLTPGRKPSDPILTNQSKALSGMIEYLKSRYDHIILKAAPMGILSDSIPLAKLTNGVITVGQFEKTREDEFEELVQNLKDIHAHTVGSVLTSFSFEKSPNYYTGYFRAYRRAYNDYFVQDERRDKKKGRTEKQTVKA